MDPFNPAREIKAILFDFDGTLAPNLDLPDMRRQVIALTKTHNVPAQVVADRFIVEIIDAASDWLKQRGAHAQAAPRDRHHGLQAELLPRALRRAAPVRALDHGLLRRRREAPRSQCGQDGRDERPEEQDRDDLLGPDVLIESSTDLRRGAGPGDGVPRAAAAARYVRSCPT